jgi:hypothetical protein
MTTANPFEAYGSEAAPVIADNRANRRAKAPSQLDLKMEEKQRLHRTYKLLKRQERIAILKTEPRLLNFMRYLRSVTGEQADELLDAIAGSDWLMTAPQSVRAFALSRVARRQEKILLMVGAIPLDDPMPPETSVFFKAQALLRQGGLL